MSNTARVTLSYTRAEVMQAKCIVGRSLWRDAGELQRQEVFQNLLAHHGQETLRVVLQAFEGEVAVANAHQDPLLLGPGGGHTHDSR